MGPETSYDFYTEVFPVTNPVTWQYSGTNTYDADYTAELASTFSKTSGQVVRLWGHVQVNQSGCSVSDVKLYVWS